MENCFSYFIEFILSNNCICFIYFRKNEYTKPCICINFNVITIFFFYNIKVRNFEPRWDVIWAVIALMFVCVVVLVILAILWRPRSMGK